MDYYRERRGVRASEAVIDRAELDTLRRMARRGQDYEAAARIMRADHAAMLDRATRDPDDEYARGWLAAIRLFSERVLRTDG